MKVFRLLIFALVFTLCLFAGYNLGTKWHQDEGSVTLITPSPRVIDSVGFGNQRNILIIGIDEISYPNPSLEGLWLLIYYRDNPRIDLIPIFPSILEDNFLRDQTLAGSFSVSSNGEPTEAFWDNLRIREILWHNYMLFDENALNAVTELVGLPTARENGYLISWKLDTKDALQNQSRLLSVICNQIQFRDFFDDISPFINQLTPHLITNISIDQINSDWRLLLAYGENLHCEFPTLSP